MRDDRRKGTEVLTNRPPTAGRTRQDAEKRPRPRVEMGVFGVLLVLLRFAARRQLRLLGLLISRRLVRDALLVHRLLDRFPGALGLLLVEVRIRRLLSHGNTSRPLSTQAAC